ncbi:nucleotide sugar dehydrogenase [Halorubrum ezzemoulense]|uniref:nucleotide sugar dehydrogenase n=1 Tax=Halorubrum ezzemoulense TaxID=337243 RepID=UPI00232DB78D|nr:nucleotide sugar dehydrogenase [Halorubrum ezzemoulense]MDB2252498.1 nucleotide sugar dehydrogenase [Halorubrum ezzemoulense]
MSTVCVHGLGYIGLPTAAMLANYDHEVYGYDADPKVTAQLADGDVHIDEPGLRAFVTQARESGQLEIVDEVVPAAYHVICVPTPFDEEQKEADVSYIESSGKGIVPVLQEGDTVILESTVPPGTTENTLQPILEESGLNAGSDFALAHCPETVLPGDIIAELQENNRIIGGINGDSTQAATQLYKSFVEGEIRSTNDVTTAEFVKLIQNTYRDTNIALANEIAKLAADYDINSREAINLANEHPRVDILRPGPGVGGHCLPIDPWFLGANSNQLDLIKTARQVNDGMVDYIKQRLINELGDLRGKKIAILGVAYKGDVGDTRMSPGLSLAQSLQQEEETAAIATDGGCDKPEEVAIHDPHVDDDVLNLLDLEDATGSADAVVIATDHTEYENLPVALIADWMSGNTIVDTKGILSRESWEAKGFSVQSI